MAQSTPKIVGRLCQTPVQLGRLQAQVNDAANALATAQSRSDGFAQRIKQLITIAEGLWTQNSGAAGISPIASLVEAYDNVAALENCLADFPRIRKQLVLNLDAAKQQLAEFQRRSPK